MIHFDDIEIGRKYTRPELAAKWGYAGYQALARGVVTPARQNLIILFVTRLKQEGVQQYNDYLSGDHLHWEGEDGHGTDDRIERVSASGEAIHLFYREIHHSPFEYKGTLALTSAHRETDKPSRFVFRLTHDQSPLDDIEAHAEELTDLAPTEKEAIISARLGQGRFREDLFAIWRGCAVTNVVSPYLLRASHIKPWRWSTNAERLNPFNGLLLLPHLDHLFDRGLITFDENGAIALSEVLSSIDRTALSLTTSARLRRLPEDTQPFLAYHREQVFVTQVGSSE